MSDQHWGQSDHPTSRPQQSQTNAGGRGQDNTNDQQSSNDPKAIEDDISRTRARMGETIDELERRLNPDRIATQVTESVREATIGRAEQMAYEARETARDVRTSVVDTIKQNPVPAALAAIGIGWLVMSGSNDSHSHRERRRYTYASDPYAAYPYGGAATHRTSGGGAMTEQARGEANRMMGEAQDRASQMTDRARESASQVQSSVGDAASRAQDEASRVADEARHRGEQLGMQAEHQMHQARRRFDDVLRENPLAVGAAAVAVGAAIGFSLPETPQEQHLMGDARDRLVDRAQQTARETMEKAQHVASEAADEATRTGQEAARREGLAP